MYRAARAGRRALRPLLAAAGALALAGGLLAATASPGTAGASPGTAGTAGAATGAGAGSVTGGAARPGSERLTCDIYRAAGTPCVGAYSTVRALYAAYRGPLYRVTRASDGAARNIPPLSPGGVADAAAQDAFCAGTSCTITEIYDQSPEHNDLGIEGAGGNGAADVGAPAAALPVKIHGHRAYGVKISAGTGYRDDQTAGVAVHGQPESMYMVTSSQFVNGQCCFDFGNAETSNDDTGNGHMDAVSFSVRCARFSPCYGTGPWVQADLENGLFQSNDGYSQNPLNTGLNVPYVTALLKNNGQDYFALKAGNAQAGSLTTEYAGLLPTIQGGGYSPMQQEGAIVLGTGGDNSNLGTGYFYEGVMTAGLPSDTADDAVQAGIVAAGYGR
jgi:non-reducing end alpha-L-arabinofuranosidase